MDDVTGLIEDNIPTVLDSLFINYGKVQSEEVKSKEAEFLNLTFNPANPMVTLYRSINQLQNLATVANILYSDAQQLENGLTLIRNTRDLEEALGEWTNKPVGDKTRENFKLYFKDTQAELKEIRGPMMQHAGYHHAKILATRLHDDMVSRDTSMLAMVQEFAVAITEADLINDPPQT